jgi:hypothetical protein
VGARRADDFLSSFPLRPKRALGVLERRGISATSRRLWPAPGDRPEPRRVSWRVVGPHDAADLAAGIQHKPIVGLAEARWFEGEPGLFNALY